MSKSFFDARGHGTLNVLVLLPEPDLLRHLCPAQRALLHPLDALEADADVAAREEDDVALDRRKKTYVHIQYAKMTVGRSDRGSKKKS